MSTLTARGFWVTNHLANPILRPLLRGPLGSRLGRRLGVLRYRGRRSGQARELVVQYVRDGDRVWVMPGQPNRKQWWHNMREPMPVELWLAGQNLHGVASAISDRDQPTDVVDALTVYRTVFPRARNAGGSTVMVRIDVDRAH